MKESTARSNSFRINLPLPCFSRLASQSTDASEAEDEAIDEPRHR